MLPSSIPSKTQIDLLGDRLRQGEVSEEDLRLLDSYRRSFSDAYENVVRQVRDQLDMEPTGRPAKSTTSIVDKLRRESIRLSQMQDIAGCRVVVSNLLEQDEAFNQLRATFHDLTVVDRRERPSSGYRAVHAIVSESDKLIEMQIRTPLQHLWSEVSEKIADVLGSEIKYGRGDEAVLKILAAASEDIREHELVERQHLQILFSGKSDETAVKQEASKVAEIAGERLIIAATLNLISEIIPKIKGPKNAVSDPIQSK